MKFSLAAIAALLLKSAAATAVPSSWEGNLNMKMVRGSADFYIKLFASLDFNVQLSNLFEITVHR